MKNSQTPLIKDHLYLIKHPSYFLIAKCYKVIDKNSCYMDDYIIFESEFNKEEGWHFSLNEPFIETTYLGSYEDALRDYPEYMV